MKGMKSKTVALFLTVLTCSATFLTGCHFTPDVPSEKEVLAYVDEHFPAEDMTYKKVKSKSKDDSPLYTYTFTSEDRDLEFNVEATSYLVRGSSGAAVPFSWEPSITDDFDNSLRKYYFDEIMDVCEDYETQIDLDEDRLVSGEKYDGRMFVYVDSYDELESVAQFCEDLNDVYHKEKKFNDYEWMDAHPLYEVLIFKGSTYCALIKVDINGQDSYDDCYEYMNRVYVQSVYDGKIEDSLVTDFEGYHKSELEILVDGYGIDEDDINSKKPNKWETNRFIAKYDYETESYYLPMNLKVNDVNPELLEFYIECADGEIKGDGSDYQKFKIGSDEYKIELDMKGTLDKYIEDFDIYKNGKKQKISYLEKTSQGQYVFWINIDDMADIFGFDYHVDEASGFVDLWFD